VHSKTEEAEDRQFDVNLEDLDIAYEGYFVSCKKVRMCPYCEGGWVVSKKISPVSGKMGEYATECDCFVKHLKVYRMMKAAQKSYLRRTGNEAPEYDRARADLFEYAGDEKLRKVET